MERLPTRLPGLVLLAPAVHGDARGFFMETYRADAWAAEGVAAVTPVDGGGAVPAGGRVGERS